MKNSSIATGTISLSPLAQPGKCNNLRQFLSELRDLLSPFKEHIQLGLATVTVGAIFLGSIFAIFYSTC